MGLVCPQRDVQLVKSPRQFGDALPPGLLAGPAKMGVDRRDADATAAGISDRGHAGAQRMDQVRLCIGEAEQLLQHLEGCGIPVQRVVYQQHRHHVWVIGHPVAIAQQRPHRHRVSRQSMIPRHGEIGWAGGG
jgi:hypothetical protein